MKYFSEKLNRVFDTAEACEKAELELKIKEEKAKIDRETAVAQRKADAKEIEDLLKSRREIDKAIDEKLNAFCKKHGPFHYSVKETSVNPFDFFFDSLFNTNKLI